MLLRTVVRPNGSSAPRATAPHATRSAVRLAPPACTAARAFSATPSALAAKGHDQQHHDKHANVVTPLPPAQVLPALFDKLAAEHPAPSSGVSSELYDEVRRTDSGEQLKLSMTPDKALPRLPTVDDYRAIVQQIKAGDALIKLEETEKASPLEQPGYLARAIDEVRATLSVVNERFDAVLNAPEADDEARPKLTPAPPADDAFIDPSIYVRLAQAGEKAEMPQLVHLAYSEFQSAYAHLCMTAGERSEYSSGGASLPAEITALHEYKQLERWADELRQVTVRASQSALEQIAAIDQLQAEFDAEEQNLPYLTVEQELLANPEWLAEINRAQREHRWFEPDLQNPAPEEEHHH